MGKVVTVMNMKGGVGKTTVAMHVAGAISRFKHPPEFDQFKKILLIDYDPQFNLSQAYIPSKIYFDLEKQHKTTLGILVDDDSNLNPYEVQVPGNHNPPSVTNIRYEISSFTDGGCLHIVPSTLNLMYLALGQSATKTTPMEERFDKFIAECRKLYDLILIDCHPAGSIFTRTSLKNSDHVLIPVTPERFATRGIGLMLKFIEAKKGNTAPTPLILFNKTSRGGGASSFETQIRANPNFGPHCMSFSLRNYGAFSEPEEGKGFVWLSKKAYSKEARINAIRVAREFTKLIK